MHYKTEAEPFKEWVLAVNDIVNEIKINDKSFYRVIMHKNDNYGSYSSDTLFGYYGISDFGDQEKYKVRKFLSNIGFATSPRVTFEPGYNPVSEMLLGIKYGINAPDTFDSENPNSSGKLPDYDINQYALNVGYMVDGQVLYYD